MRPMRITCWITKTTNANPEYVTLIVIFTAKWLHERASMLRYTYVSCPVPAAVFSLLQEMQRRGSVGWPC
jgi:hypothetical protein